MAGESLQFARALDHVMATVYRKEFAPLKATKHFPVSFEGGKGTRTITHRMIDRVGNAAIGLGFPLIDLRAREFSTPVRPLTGSYKYGITDLWAAEKSGINLPLEDAIATKEAIKYLEDELAYTGDEETGLLGAFTHPNVPIQVADHTIDSRSTPDQIIAVFNKSINAITSLSKGRRRANHCLMTTKAYTYIATTRLPETDTTILQFLETAHPQVTFDWCDRCERAGIGGTDVLFSYDRNEDSIILQIPHDFEQLPEYWDGESTTVKCIELFGGIRYIYVTSILTIGV